MILVSEFVDGGSRETTETLRKAIINPEHVTAHRLRSYGRSV